MRQLQVREHGKGKDENRCVADDSVAEFFKNKLTNKNKEGVEK